MQELIHKQMVKALCLFLFQLLVAVFLLVAYQIQLFEYISEVIIASLAVFIIIDILFVWTVLSKIANAKKKSDAEAVDVIGNDIQDAYNFGKIGLVITDDASNVIWMSEWFNDIQSKVIDQNIYDWIPQLIELRDANNDKELNVAIDNHIYQVKNLKDANLFIFKDITEFQTMVDFSKEHCPVVGLISIDNYAEVAQLIDDTKYMDLIGAIQKDISNYAKRFNLLLKRYRNDSYIVICNYESYEKIFLDNFSLIDEVRSETAAEYNELTISVGVATGTYDFCKLSDMANSALDVALSRGGDQAVISPFGENLIFIGGKTEAKGNRNRVKVKVLAQSLSALMNDASNILIMGHNDTDLDSLGSSLGIHAIAMHLKKDAKIIYDEKLTESKTRKAFKQMFTRDEIKKITVSPKQALESINPKTLVILTDVHRPSLVLAPAILDEAERVAVIDHHRRAEEFVDRPVFVHIEPSASSASELVAEIVRYSENKIQLPENYATIMLAGIFLDTNYYRQKTGSRTYDASMILKEYGADNVAADEFLKEEYEEYALKMKIMSNSSTPYYGIVIALSDQADIIERTILAVVATEMLQIKGINACFVIGRTGDNETRISARSDGTINVQMLLEKMGGGGHFTSSAAAFNGKTILEVNEQLKGVLELYLQDARIEESAK